MIPTLFDFSKMKKIVDIGGGNATNCLAINAAHPTLECIVYDSKSICKTANENIKYHKKEKFITTYEGNILSDSLPEDIDGIFLCHFLTIWSPEENKQILKKCYDSLPKGGRVFIYNMATNENGVGPVMSSLGPPYFLTIATGKGALYRMSQFRVWVIEAGFEIEKLDNSLPMEHLFIAGKKVDHERKT